MKSKTEEEKGLKKEARGMKTKRSQDEFKIHLILSFKRNCIAQNFVQSSVLVYGFLCRLRTLRMRQTRDMKEG